MLPANRGGEALKTLLDGLHRVIEKLRERAEVHQQKLGQSEALTRNALVDPLLRVLGWDTEDPGLVVPEHKLGSGFADYALLDNGKPAIVVEAKKLGAPLDGAASQGIAYCIQDGIKYLAVTDGKQWDVYETHRAVPLPEKKIVSFDIAGPPAIVCLDALALWRRSVQNGTVRKAQRPLLDPERDSGAVQPASRADGENQQAPEGDWRPLAKLQPKSGDKRPREVRFPDGSTAPIKFWADVPQSVVKWLIQVGKLNEKTLPVQRGGRCLLANKAVHPDGKRFKSTKKVGRFYLEAKYSAADQVSNAKLILEKAAKGVIADQFSVRLSQ